MAGAGILRHGESTRALFAELVHEVRTELGQRPSPEASGYVVDLLDARVRSEPAGSAPETYAEAFCEALLEDGAGRFVRLRALGDRALFEAGFFHDRLRQSLVGIEYYQDMGRMAYARLSAVVGGGQDGEGYGLYHELSQRFGDFVELLAEVGDRARGERSVDLLRLYDRYCAEGAERDRLRLLRHGLVPDGAGPGARPLTAVETAVGHVAGWLARVYALDLELRAEEHVLAMSGDDARELLPPGCRSGVLVVEEDDALHVGLHLAPEDTGNEGTLVEETSHLVCVAWHGQRNLPVSRLILELQGDVDRFVFARLAGRRSPRECLVHFQHFRFADALGPEDRARYVLANERAHAYCRRLCARYPKRADTPALLSELRRFYRASPEEKLRAA